MSPTIAELLEALPVDDEETLAADRMLQRLLADRILGEEMAAVVYGPYSQTKSNEEVVDVI